MSPEPSYSAACREPQCSGLPILARGHKTKEAARVAWLQLLRLLNFQESKVTALCLLHNNFSASEEQIWGFS